MRRASNNRASVRTVPPLERGFVARAEDKTCKHQVLVLTRMCVMGTYSIASRQRRPNFCHIDATVSMTMTSDRQISPVTCNWLKGADRCCVRLNIFAAACSLNKYACYFDLSHICTLNCFLDMKTNHRFRRPCVYTSTNVPYAESSGHAQPSPTHMHDSEGPCPPAVARWLPCRCPVSCVPCPVCALSLSSFRFPGPCWCTSGVPRSLWRILELWSR